MPAPHWLAARGGACPRPPLPEGRADWPRTPRCRHSSARREAGPAGVCSGRRGGCAAWFGGVLGSRGAGGAEPAGPGRLLGREAGPGRRGQLLSAGDFGAAAGSPFRAWPGLGPRPRSLELLGPPIPIAPAAGPSGLQPLQTSPSVCPYDLHHPRVVTQAAPSRRCPVTHVPELPRRGTAHPGTLPPHPSARDRSTQALTRPPRPIPGFGASWLSKVGRSRETSPN